MRWLYLFTAVHLIYLSNAWIITIDSYTNECFGEFVKEFDKIGLIFMVTEGGFLDIDVSIRDPDKVLLHEAVRETSGKYTIIANKAGKYEICFSSNKSSQTPKEVMFDVLTNMDKEWEIDEKGTLSNESATLHSMVTELGTSLKIVQQEQNYMGRLIRMHMKVNEHINLVVARWALFETLVIVLGTGFEIWYIQRFFEVRWML